jgi:hypothetical protein
MNGRLLSDLLASGDFRTAVDRLAREFRERHGLPSIHQLGIVVPEVESAAGELEARGIGPFFIAAGSPALWRERGEDRTYSGKLGIAYHQGLELELLEPGEGSDFYRRKLDPEGRAVVQHLGLSVDDVDEWASRLEGEGYPVWVRGKLKTGPLRTDFAYMDTEAAAGLVIEFICWRLFGRRFSPPGSVFHAIGRLEKLLGKRCLAL